MKKLCSVLTILVLLPLAAFGNIAPGTTAPVVPTEEIQVGGGQPTGYDCCWVFFMGRWRCIPC